MADAYECSMVVRYRSQAQDGWPWAVTHESGRRVLTITDLDDSALGVLLRALARAGDLDDSTRTPQPQPHLLHG